MTKRWKATIRLAHGLHQVVFVSADTFQKASLLLELQFGKSRVLGAPQLVALAHDTVEQFNRQPRLAERVLARFRETRQ